MLLNAKHSIKVEIESEASDIDWNDAEYGTDWESALKSDSDEDEEIDWRNDESLSGSEALANRGADLEDIFSAFTPDTDLFDETIYDRAKPHFDAALKHFGGDDVRAAMTRLLYALKEDCGFTAENVRKMRPYVIHFVKAWQSSATVSSRSDKEALPNEPTNEKEESC